MFKRPDSTKDCYISVKRARLDCPQRDPQHSKADKIPENKKAQDDDLWGDDFAEEDIEEMDMIASQAYLQVLQFTLRKYSI